MDKRRIVLFFILSAAFVTEMSQPWLSLPSVLAFGLLQFCAGLLLGQWFWGKK